jgi:DNA modification methylase
MRTNTHRQLTITYQSVETLKESTHNSRKHSPRQIRQIANSINRFGFLNPVLVDHTGTLVAGHARVAAARVLGMTRIPTVPLEGLTEAEILAFIIADNRLAENSEWDLEKLAVELMHLEVVDPELDLSITGFAVPEIDLIIEAGNKQSDPDDVFECDGAAPVTKTGDLWLLGKHRLLCGNSLEIASYKAVCNGQKAAVAFSDPPYNVRIDGHASGNGSVHHSEFRMAAGEMSQAQFVAFLSAFMSHLVKFSRPGSVHFIAMDWRHIGELLAAGLPAYGELLNVCVWVKDNAGLGSFYRSQHELILVFRNGEFQHRNNIQLGKFGRNRTNVWTYPSANTFSRQGEEGNLLALHPTVKPVSLIADALLDCSARGEIVLDPFIGSGSTLIAAERIGRLCYGVEIDPVYVDVAIRRWQKITGERAVHALSGKVFDEGTPFGEGNHA